MSMKELKMGLFEEFKRISNRELTGDELVNELDRVKMVNECAKTYITAAMAEIKISELTGEPLELENQNGTDVNRPVISGGKRRSLLGRK